MSLASLLSIARTALATHQRAIDVTGHNIANANTPGYTRQRLELAAEIPLNTPYGTVGRGVRGIAVFNARDQFLDAAFRREQGTFSHADTLRSALQRVSGVLNEPSDTGIGAALDGLWSAFSDLADAPSTGASRVAVRSAAQLLATRLRDADARLTSESVALRQDFEGTVARINQLGGEIADLNRQIVARGGPLETAPDLADLRDAKIDELATLTQVRVLPRDHGAVAVLTGDAMLVDGAFAQQLETRTLPGGGLGAGLVGSTRLAVLGGGKLQALAELSTSGIPGVRAELDRLAQALVTTINGIHGAGMTNGGATGIDLFDPAGVTAGTIAVSAAVLADPTNIVTGATAASGDNSIALQLAALRDTPFAALNSDTPGAFYAGVVGSLGSIVRDATQAAEASDVVLAGIETQRQSVHGVSTDEEMVKLIQQQQAFSAAARLVVVADEMMQDVLRMV
ncbi:MAG: flagellar hook-associated protein FlgK [Gemmatimonadetes bacterium]|nr:flagellar hook-associated protein FlgK [Gemmatimonadota bacterium]MCB9518847.1 flagellar hook-associated protein FlgK [Gemmatimonadales bacterium]